MGVGSVEGLTRLDGASPDANALPYIRATCSRVRREPPISPEAGHRGDAGDEERGAHISWMNVSNARFLWK